MSKVKGVANVKANFNKAFSEIKNKKAAKATYAALTVLDQEQALIVPVLTSNLANNRTLTVREVSNKTIGTILFLSNYAAAVHKMVGVNWTRSTTQEQWLTTAAQKARPEIDAIFKKVMKV